MPEVLERVLSKYFFIFYFAFVSCSGQVKDPSNPDFFGVNTFISLLEYDLVELEDEIRRLGEFTEGLFLRQNELISTGDRSLYKIEGVAANSEPGADPERSSLYITQLANDPRKVEDMILVTNPLDSVFRKIIQKYPVVSQVYFNSPIQLNRLFPPYNVYEMLEPDLDLTAFNFYYEADEVHNPERKPVWVDEMYIDPVGRGWMITLTQPVYHMDELKLVLGMDLTLNDIIENYINKTSHQILIIDKEGTVVAGKSKTIEVFSLPPLKNHTYTQTITSDSFRKEDFNLFKSRSSEVRRIADGIINHQQSEVWMTVGQRKIKVVSKKTSKLDWFVLEIFL
jgi:hypothetical protein